MKYPWSFPGEDDKSRTWWSSLNSSGTRFQRSLEDFSDEDWIPWISLGLIVLALLFSNSRYWIIDSAMTLLFYAVLVRIWTEIGSGVPKASEREFAFLEFLVMSAGAVIVGFTLEEAARYITGDLIAIQSLALAVIISRIYVNLQDKDASSLKEVLRYQEPVDRYLIWVPCLIAFGIPVLVYQMEMYSVYLETTRRFFQLLVASLGGGIVLYIFEDTQ